MKFSLAIIGVLFAASLSLPALAQDWDMAPLQDLAATQNTAAAQSMALMQDAVPTPAQVYNQAVTEEIAEERAANQAPINFDISALRAEQLGNTTFTTGALDNVPHTTGTTGKQLISTLPVCATHTLSRISGPVNANGLPTCSLDSFVKMAGGKAEKIYGDEGRNSYPPLKDFQSINSGIDGESAAGLTTGQH